jgi:hypothetical protein
VGLSAQPHADLHWNPRPKCAEIARDRSGPVTIEG